MTIAQGWYEDPWDAAHFRWWDGLAWTQHRQPRQAPVPTPAPVMTVAAPAAVATRAPAATFPAMATATSEVRAPESVTTAEQATRRPRTGGTALPDLRLRVPAQAMLERLGETHGLGHLPVGARARDLKIDTPARVNYLGVTGERQVAEILTGLPSDWTVLHSVPTGASTGNIDHIVIGPAGVFTIKVRHHPDANIALRDMVLTANGQVQHCLPSTVNDSRRAAKELSDAVGFPVPATGVLVFVGVKNLDDTSRAGQAGALLWRDEDLLQELAKAPRVLDPERLAAVAAAAARPETWHVRPRLHSDVTPLVRDFDLFEQAIALADKRSKVGVRLVIIGGATVLVAGVAYFAWPYVSGLLGLG